MFSRRAGGDPTEAPDVTGTRAITYDNPGYREGEQSKYNIRFNDNKYIQTLNLF